MAPDVMIQFIRNFTAEPIGQAVEEAAARIGLSVKASFGSYDNLGAEIALLAAGKPPPQIAVVTIDLDYFAGGSFSPKWNRIEVIDEFKSLLAAIDVVPSKTFILITTFIPPFRTSMPWSPNHAVLGKESVAFELNALVREFVSQHSNRCGLLDYERIAARLGERATLDKRFGLMMKAPFKEEFVAAAAEDIIRLLRCQFLPPRKALVLDCDNTLWGGLIGESGLEAIQLDPYEYPGVAYYRFQSEVLAAAEKGVLICLCSKNDDSSVWDVLDHHPHCLLRRNIIAAHRINWADKASNVKALALELNLALNSMVFIDDDPAECELIRSQLPEVEVIQVPTRIYELPDLLKAGGLFDRLSLSAEDKQRLHYYQAEKGRRELQERHLDAEGFLKDLRMKAAVRPLQNGDLSRASQLCQRTNQFNLTSKRYTESDLAGLLEAPEVKMFLLQAEDRFGSMGQSGLIIFKRSGSVVEVDNFLMSCRVIGRQLDRALFCEGLRRVRDTWSPEEVRATFVPTQRNSVVAGLWTDYGFSRIPSSGGETYACRVAELRVSFPEVVELAENL